MTTDPTPNPPSPANTAPTPPIDEHQLKMALTAFKKRMKLTKLDEESRLGGGRPTTTGKKSALLGIVAPREFKKEVWVELARQGKIKDVGGGFYALV